jgi:transposase
MSENPAVELPHDEQGISEATRRLREAEPRLVVLEATGGLETELAASLMAAGLAVVVVNPRQVRDYAKATGQLAKTDRIDAWMLADFARAIRPAVRPMKEMFTRELDAPADASSWRCGFKNPSAWAVPRSCSRKA